MKLENRDLSPKIETPEAKKEFSKFWSHRALDLDWFKTFETIYSANYDEGKFSWFPEGRLNASFNCLDRHIRAGHGQRVAFHFEYESGQTVELTYQDLLSQVSHVCHTLKAKGFQKGDRAIVYMPVLPETYITLLAMARMGIVHSVVFAGLSAKALQKRVKDCQAKAVFTLDYFYRGQKKVHLYETTKELSLEIPTFVWSYNKNEKTKLGSRDYCMRELLSQLPNGPFAPEEMNSEDPLFILYTSGSTGNPKGLVHTTGGYLTHALYTYKTIFQMGPDDVYWCTADIGWITGHTYSLYGPLLQGATSVLYEGALSTPHWGRCWDIVQKYQVSHFYTAPTAIRSFMSCGMDYHLEKNLNSLKVLGTVGEPINQEAYDWYFRQIGQSRCPIVDTWWQTETGGVLISAIPGLDKVNRPLPGIYAAVKDDRGQIQHIAGRGPLLIETPWPGMARTIYNDHERYLDTYFRPHPGSYFTGDRANIEDGQFTILGRMDDVLNVSGHRLGTAEIESALCHNHHVAEAAAIGLPDALTGEKIVAVVVLQQNCSLSREELVELLNNCVAQEIGKIARPKDYLFTSDLPKTRSGKIMRRIIKKIALKQYDAIGDISTLADPKIIDELKQSISSQIN